MLPDHHRGALSEISERLIPLAESALPALRRPFARQLDKYLDSISELIRSDPARALTLCGRAIDGVSVSKLAPVVESVRARHAANLRSLCERLATGAPLSIAAFAGALVRDLESGMEVQCRISSKVERGFQSSGQPELDEVARTLGLDPRDLVAIIESDTAFRALHYFLEALKPVLEAVQPRSLLSVRGRA